MIEVVAADLDQLVAGALLEPAGEPRVVVRPRRLGQACVGDLADEHVLETERDLAADRRARLGEQEVAEQQVVDRLADVLDVRREVLDGAGPEDPADHGSSTEHRAVSRREPVDARADQRLQRVGDALDAAAAAALQHHAYRLLDVQRVALRLVEQGSPGVGLERAGLLGQERFHEQLALGAAECLELDRGRAHAATAPTGVDVEELGAGEAEDEERRPHPVGEVLDQLEERLLGPVDVLEAEDDRLCLGELLDEGPGGPGDLLRRALAVERLQHAGGEAEEVGDGLVLAVCLELLERLLDRVVVGDARNGLDHLGQGPVGDALAVREAATDEHRCALEPVDELAREPALADAGLAVDREQVGAAVAHRAVEGVAEQLELGFAADQRRADARRAARAGVPAQTARQTGIGSFRPLSSNGPTSSASIPW